MKFYNPIQPVLLNAIQDKQHVKTPENLVLSGGGIKGLAYAGVIKALEEKNLFKNIKRFAGSSAGAITAALLAIGMNSEEINEQMTKVKFSSFLQKSNVNIEKIAHNPLTLLDPIIGGKVIYDELEHKGLCDASVFTQWLTSMFKLKGFDESTTYKQLYQKTQKELYITMCNLNYGKTVIANHENTPDMPVVPSVRASMSIPFVYMPFIWEGDTYVDGGTMYNYPLEVFDNISSPDKTIGMILSTSSSVLNPQRKEDKNFLEHIINIYDCLRNVSYEYCFRSGNEYRTVFIDTDIVKSLDFDISDEQKKILYDNGYNAVMNYLS